MPVYRVESQVVNPLASFPIESSASPRDELGEMLWHGRQFAARRGAGAASVQCKISGPTIPDPCGFVTPDLERRDTCGVVRGRFDSIDGKCVFCDTYCRSWLCPLCAACLRRDWFHVINSKIGAAEKLFITTGFEKTIKAAVKETQKLGGDYVTVAAVGDQLWLLSTIPVARSRRVGAFEASREFESALRNVPQGRRRPVNSSRGWALNTSQSRVAESFADKFRAARAGDGISLAELATKITYKVKGEERHVRESTLASLERGETRPTRTMARKIANALEIPLRDLDENFRFDIDLGTFGKSIPMIRRIFNECGLRPQNLPRKASDGRIGEKLLVKIGANANYKAFADNLSLAAMIGEAPSSRNLFETDDDADESSNDSWFDFGIDRAAILHKGNPSFPLIENRRAVATAAGP